MMMTTTINSPEIEAVQPNSEEPLLSLTPHEILEEQLCIESVYEGVQALTPIEKKEEILSHIEQVSEEIRLIQEEQLSLLPEEKSEMTLPAVLCDDQLLQEISHIPERLAFKIGDVADMLGIKQYVLRYWESEFEILKPKKAQNNQRMYSKKDVENAYLIRKLLHRDRFSIEGARQALKALKSHVKKEKTGVQAQVKMTQKFEHVHEKLESLLSDIRKIKDLVS